MKERLLTHVALVFNLYLLHTSFTSEGMGIPMITVDSLITHTPRPLADGVCVSNETKNYTRA
jgi:hypothetical protein